MATVQMTFAGNRSFLGGHELFSGTSRELLDALDDKIASDTPHLVITPNVDQALRLGEDSQSRLAFKRASLRLIDGFPLLALARLLGDARASRHTGADLMVTAASEAVARSWRVAITGGEAEVTRAAAENLTARYPGAEIDAFPFPIIRDVYDPKSLEVVEALNAYRPDIVFLCLGFPKQELWFLAWEDRLPAAVYVGAGAAVEFAAGNRSRAPEFVQQAGFEWLWRLAQEPRRLAHRYLVRGPRFLGLVLRSLKGRS